MKALFLLFSFLFSMNVFAHCPMDFAEAELCAEVEWIDGPHLDKKSHFQLSFWEKGDNSHTPVSPDFDVKIYSWMIMHNGHNHGGPALKVKEISEGVFEVKNARFFMHGMHGYWEIRADLSEDRNLVSRAATKVEFDGHGGGHDH